MWYRQLPNYIISKYILQNIFATGGLLYFPEVHNNKKWEDKALPSSEMQLKFSNCQRKVQKQNVVHKDFQLKFCLSEKVEKSVFLWCNVKKMGCVCNHCIVNQLLFVNRKTG